MREELFKVKNYTRNLINNHNAKNDQNVQNESSNLTRAYPSTRMDSENIDLVKQKSINPTSKSIDIHSLYQDLFIIDLKDEIDLLKKECKLH
jgi:hypothetical protein